MAFLLGMAMTFAYAQGDTGSDSIRHLDEVVVTSKLTFREVIPSQKMSGEQLEKLNTHSVADALRYFSGLQLKDYGGVGGIKTVNIRSMGTNHLGIYYDGVELGNAQNGQIDLGQFSLDNVDEVTLYNGQKSAIFQTASDFGNAGSVYIRTHRPWFSYGETHHLKASVKYGSSDMIRLSGLYEQKLNDDLSLSLSAGFLNASGKYKFRYRRVNIDGTTAWDTTAVRQNGDIHAERLEANLSLQLGARHTRSHCQQRVAPRRTAVGPQQLLPGSMAEKFHPTLQQPRDGEVCLLPHPLREPRLHPTTRRQPLLATRVLLHHLTRV